MGFFSFLRNWFLIDFLLNRPNRHCHHHHHHHYTDYPDAPYTGDFGADLDANHLHSGRYDLSDYEDYANCESPELYDDFMHDHDDYDSYGSYDGDYDGFYDNGYDDHDDW